MSVKIPSKVSQVESVKIPSKVSQVEHLEYLCKEFLEHYHKERPHQSLDNEIIEPPPQGNGEIICQERLGGLLKFYRRAA